MLYLWETERVLLHRLMELFLFPSEARERMPADTDGRLGASVMMLRGKKEMTAVSIIEPAVS